MHNRPLKKFHIQNNFVLDTKKLITSFQIIDIDEFTLGKQKIGLILSKLL